MPGAGHHAACRCSRKAEPDMSVTTQSSPTGQRRGLLIADARKPGTGPPVPVPPTSSRSQSPRRHMQQTAAGGGACGRSRRPPRVLSDPCRTGHGHPLVVPDVPAQGVGVAQAADAVPPHPGPDHRPRAKTPVRDGERGRVHVAGETACAFPDVYDPRPGGHHDTEWEITRAALHRNPATPSHTTACFLSATAIAEARAPAIQAASSTPCKVTGSPPLSQRDGATPCSDRCGRSAAQGGLSAGLPGTR